VSSPWKDSISPSVMYIANIPAGMQLWQIGKLWKPCIQVPDFSPRLPWTLEIGTDSAESKKCMIIDQKYGYHSLQHEPPSPDDKSRMAAGHFCLLIDEGPAILPAQMCIRVFVLPIAKEALIKS
jgi:hypothetical protein